MFKEIVICIIILILIFVLDIFTQNFTENVVEKITEKCDSVESAISRQDVEQVNKEMESLQKEWEENMHDTLAYYIEHDELEKVDTAIITMKSYIQTNDFSNARAKLEEGKFVLEHIEDKNKFNLQNIF